MSDTSNQQLIELAHELEEYWQGTFHAELIHNDLEAGDLSALHYHTMQAHAAMFEAEYAPKGADNAH